MNVLAIGAHPDDIEILCGGTLALYAEEGHSIFTAVATDGSVGTPDLTKAEISAIRRQEQEASAALLGATLIWMGFEDEWLFNDRPTRTAFLDAIRQADPDIMFVHSPNDYIADHRVASQIATDCRIPASVRLVETALPACSKIPHVFFMDNVAGIDFSPEHYVDISSVLPRKAEMLACHKSQEIWMQQAYGESLSRIMLRNARHRGLAINAEAAEAFRSLRTYPVTRGDDLLPGRAR